MSIQMMLRRVVFRNSINRRRYLIWPNSERTASIFLMIAGAPNSTNDGLLDCNFGAGRFDLFLDFFGFFLGHAFFQRFRCAFDKSFGFG